MSEKTEKKIGRPAIPVEERHRPRSIGVTDADWQRWHAAAAAEEMTLSEWLRGLADRRAAEVL